MLPILLAVALSQVGSPVAGMRLSDYQTMGNIGAFVDADGGIDRNNCVVTSTDGGVAPTTCTGTCKPCATFNGVYAKLPRIIRHNVTVNVAAGNYAFSSKWDSVQWGSAATSPTATTLVEFLGPALTNVTPSTGTATGTTTSVSATNPNPLPTLTDSGQSWTTNELRGRFVTMTSGPANGISRVIVANTATTLTTTPWTTAPAVGNTYAIQTPAAVITGEHGLSGHFGGTGQVRFTRLDFTSASTTLGTWTLRDNASNLSLFAALTAFRKTTGASPTISASRSRTFSGASITGNAAAPWYAEQLGTGTAVSVFDPPSGSASLIGFAYASAASAVRLDAGGAVFGMLWTLLVAETGSTSSTPFFVSGGHGAGGGLTSSTVSVRCPSGSTAAGFQLVNSEVTLSNVEAVNCATGVLVGSTSDRQTTALTLSSGGTSPSLRCTSTTTCVSVALGGILRNTITPTFSGVTNEYLVDGAPYTHAAVNAMSPKRVTGNAGSILELE